jgi:hypothetical protein
MLARIYKPVRTAMQSGTARTKEWLLDYEPERSIFRIPTDSSLSIYFHSFQQRLHATPSLVSRNK